MSNLIQLDSYSINDLSLFVAKNQLMLYMCEIYSFMSLGYDRHKILTYPLLVTVETERREAKFKKVLH